MSASSLLADPSGIAAGSLLFAWFSVIRNVLIFALMAGAVFVGSVATLFIGPERRKMSYMATLAELERFERQRIYPPTNP